MNLDQRSLMNIRNKVLVAVAIAVLALLLFSYVRRAGKATAGPSTTSAAKVDFAKKRDSAAES